MEKGTVKFFSGTFGFISPHDGSEDIFVHQSSINAEGYRTLTAGDIVTYEITQEDRGPAAVNVNVV